MDDAHSSLSKYLKNSVVGTIPVYISRYMGTISRHDGKPLITGSILMNWWDIYCRSNDLIKNGYLYPDDKISKIL